MHHQHAGTYALAVSALLLGLSFRAVQAAPAAACLPTECAQLAQEYKRPLEVPFPADNAPTPDRELLGRTLFFDPRLSGSGFISCASCHNPGLSWGDGLPRAIGHGMKTLDRRTPTILNLAWGDTFFWDGRAESLEQQALGPIAAPGEMNLPLDVAVQRLESIPGYRELFARAYGSHGITTATIGKAIATFERTAVSGKAPFDRWVEGDEAAIGDDAQRGFLVFNREGRCAKCHSGWRLSDDSFHDIGVATGDAGRAMVLKAVPSLQSAFKTPTLRNVDRRAPYMHNGSVATLEAVVDFYDQGGLARRPSLSADIVPLRLTTQQKADLVAFLKTLSSDDASISVPILPR